MSNYSPNVNVATQYVYDPNTMSWVAEQQSGGGSGGNVTVTNFPATQSVSFSSPQHVIVDSASSVAVTNANLDVALSTRLKPSDTLTKVSTVDTITNPVAVTGGFYQTTQPVSLASAPTTPVTNSSLDGTTLSSIKADLDKIPSQGQALAAASTPVVLPALQITALTPPTTVAVTNASLDGTTLSSIKTDLDKIPSLGQALATASVPVVLTVSQLNTLTPPAAITGFALETGGNLATVATNSANLDVTLSSRLKPADTLTKVATVDTITNPVSVTGTFFPATQPVSQVNVAQEAGGSLDTLNSSARLHSKLLFAQFQSIPISNGFVPVEVPSFLIG